MSILKTFGAMTEEAKNSPVDSISRIKISFNVRVRDLYIVDRLAHAIGVSRQEVLSQLIAEGLPDAVSGYFQVMGDDPTENMSWDDFCAEVDEGRYFSK